MPKSTSTGRTRARFAVHAEPPSAIKGIARSPRPHIVVPTCWSGRQRRVNSMVLTIPSSTPEPQKALKRVVSATGKPKGSPPNGSSTASCMKTKKAKVHNHDPVPHPGHKQINGRRADVKRPNFDRSQESKLCLFVFH